MRKWETKHEQGVKQKQKKKTKTMGSPMYLYCVKRETYLLKDILSVLIQVGQI